MHKTYRRNERSPVLFDLAKLAQFFNFVQSDAATALGISVTCLKKVCRRLGVKQWPGPTRRPRAEHPTDESDGHKFKTAVRSRARGLHESPSMTGKHKCEESDYESGKPMSDADHSALSPYLMSYGHFDVETVADDTRCLGKQPGKPQCIVNPQAGQSRARGIHRLEVRSDQFWLDTARELPDAIKGPGKLCGCCIAPQSLAECPRHLTNMTVTVNTSVNTATFSVEEEAHVHSDDMEWLLTIYQDSVESISGAAFESTSPVLTRSGNLDLRTDTTYSNFVPTQHGFCVQSRTSKPAVYALPQGEGNDASLYYLHIDEGMH